MRGQWEIHRHDSGAERRIAFRWLWISSFFLLATFVIVERTATSWVVLGSLFLFLFCGLRAILSFFVASVLAHAQTAQHVQLGLQLRGLRFDEAVVSVQNYFSPISMSRVILADPRTWPRRQRIAFYTDGTIELSLLEKNGTVATARVWYPSRDRDISPRSKAEPNQSPEPTAPSGGGSS